MPRRKTRRAPVATDKRFKKHNLADTGPEERWQHSARILEHGGGAGILIARVAEEHVLDSLLRFYLIGVKEHAAGLRFLEDYVDGRVEERLTSAYSGPRNNGSRDAEARLLRSPAQEVAYKRWRRALLALSAPCRDIAVTAACMGHLPKAENIAKLQTALMQLVRHYGLE